MSLDVCFVNCSGCRRYRVAPLSGCTSGGGVCVCVCVCEREREREGKTKVLSFLQEIANLKEKLRKAQQRLTAERRVGLARNTNIPDCGSHCIFVSLCQSDDLIDLEVAPLAPGQLSRGPSPIPTESGKVQTNNTSPKVSVIQTLLPSLPTLPP